MIEPTDEMERVMYAALAKQEPGRHHAALRAGLAAVLAIVERDYDVRPRIGPTNHAFQPHENPRFGSAFGGGCGALVESRFGTVVCGWPRGAHRTAS